MKGIKLGNSELTYISIWSSILYYSCLFSLFQTPNGKARIDIVFNPITQKNREQVQLLPNSESEYLSEIFS